MWFSCYFCFFYLFEIFLDWSLFGFIVNLLLELLQLFLELLLFFHEQFVLDLIVYSLVVGNDIDILVYRLFEVHYFVRESFKLVGRVLQKEGALRLQQGQGLLKLLIQLLFLFEIGFQNDYLFFEFIDGERISSTWL